MIPTGRERVLFLCIHNSARSQMAEAWLRFLGGDTFEAASAGTDPSPIRPEAIEVMREVGVGLAAQKPKGMSEFDGMTFDTVVTVCDAVAEACPIFTRAARVLHWSIEDPATRPSADPSRLEAFRQVRDELRARIEAELLDR